MAGSVQDQTERDDAHLRSLGIKPELKRTLGFLSNFAIAFSFISVSTGTYGNFGVGLSQAGPAFFWSWPIVIVGQFIVALVFAELASHFPVAGSIYQWSKRLSNRTLGWFTGWFYFWAQVVTVTAVAVIVAYVLDGIHGPVGETAFLDTPDPPGITSMFTFISLVTLVVTTLINAYGVRLLSILNNIGVGHRDPRYGRLRARAAVLREQPVAGDPVRDGRYGASDRRQLPARLRPWPVHGPVRRLRVRHRRNVRRGDRRRGPPGAARRPVVGRDLGHRRHRLPPCGPPRDPRHDRLRWASSSRSPTRSPPR